MTFSNDFGPFGSPGRSFGKELDKLREPLSEASKKGASVAGEAAVGTSSAETLRSLVMRIVQFDNALPSDLETVARILAPGAVVEVVLEDVLPLGTSLAVFCGNLFDDSPVEVVQNVAQLNLVLVGRKRSRVDEPKEQRRFHTRHADLFEKLAAKEEAGTAPAPPTTEAD